MKLEVPLDRLSDDALLSRLIDLLGRSRRVEAELVAHLAEVDARRLYLREACPSMHVYATERLHLSDSEAYFRITVARVSRRFPVVLEMLADGRLHLSGIAKLAPHLREGNAESLLARAVHLSKRGIEQLVAEIAPQPDAPARMRKLPDRRPASGSGERPAEAPELGLDRGENCAAAGSGTPAPIAPPPAHAPPMLVPIAPARYKVQFTAGAELHEKIGRAQALLRRQVPDGDLAEVFDRAMTLLLRQLEGAKFAATSKPRKAVSETDPTPRSRRIPSAIRRAVWQRDGGQCSFRDRQGRRCPARERLEFHHATPFGQGGDHSVGNVILRCSMHNAYQAELDYGSDFMAACRRRAVLGGAG